MGVNKKKFSRLTSVISMEGSRASSFSNSMATVSPAKPPPRMSTLLRGAVFISRLSLGGGDAPSPPLTKMARSIRKPRRSHSQDFSQSGFLHDGYDSQVALLCVYGGHFHVTGEGAAGIDGSHLGEVLHDRDVFESSSSVLSSADTR